MQDLDRNLVVGTARDALPQKRPALSRPVYHEGRDPALECTPPRHEPHFVFVCVEAAETDQGRLLFGVEGRWNEIGVEVSFCLEGNFDGLAWRGQVLEEFLGTFLATDKRLKPPRVVRCEPELGTSIVVRRAQPTIFRRLDVADLLGLVAANLVMFSKFKPFCMPAFLIARHHAARREKTFADGPSPLLGLSKCTAELIRHPRVLRPVVPAVRFVMRHAVLCNRFNRFLFHIFWTLLQRHFPYGSLNGVILTSGDLLSILSTNDAPQKADLIIRYNCEWAYS